MEIQQWLVSVMTQHPQLLMAQRSQQKEIHPLQLVTVYRPPRPQLQVSWYVVHMLVVSAFSHVGFR